MNTSIRWYAAVVLISMSCCFNSQAAVIKYVGFNQPGETFKNWDTLSTYYGSPDYNTRYSAYGDIHNELVTYNITATLDTSNSTIVLDHYSFEIPAYSISYSETYTVGFGEVAEFNTTVNFNSVSYSIIDIGPLTLTPGTGGSFDVEQVAFFSGEPNSLNVTGDYVITGPTEVASGTFTASYGVTVLSPSINTTSFPDNIDFRNDFLGIYMSLFDPPYEIYDVTVDGINLAADTGKINLFQDVVMSAVPTPPAVWLFGSGLVGLVAMARRKKAV